MIIDNNDHLLKIQRMRVSEGRDLDNGLRLDRNERVSAWGKDFLTDIFSDKPDWFMSVYPEMDPLYQKLSIFLKINKENILLTSGIDGGIKTILEVCTNPGDLIGVLSPTYAMYKVYSNIFQLNLEEILYTKDLKTNFDLIYKFLETNPKILFIPNPNQPIEDTLNYKELSEICKFAESKKCLVVIDEAYHHFGAESALELVNQYQNVVVARTFSKAFGVPSIRLGFLVSSIENMNKLSKTRFAHESNTLSNAVACYLIDNFKKVETYIDEVIECRSLLKNDLKKLGINANGNTGNYLLLDLGNPSVAYKFVNYLKNNKIYVKGPWKNEYDQFITITLGPYNKMKRFIKATENFISLNKLV